MFGYDVEIDELRRPIEYLRHQLTHRLKPGLTAWILLAFPGPGLTFERHDHVHGVGILLIAGGCRPNESGTGLLQCLELIRKRGEVSVLPRLQAGLDDLDPHSRPLHRAIRQAASEALGAGP